MEQISGYQRRRGEGHELSAEESCMGKGGNWASGGDHSAVHTGSKLKCHAPETFRY